MRKKIIGLILCLCLVGVVLGCGDAGSDGSSVAANGSGAGSTTHLTPKSTPEPTPEATKPPFTQVGTQIDGGEIAGLTWVFTDAGELLVTGQVSDESILDSMRNMWKAGCLWDLPWRTYREKTIRAYIAISGATDLSYLFGAWDYELEDAYTNLLSVDMRDTDMSSVTSMDSMFYGCSSLASVEFGNVSTSSVTNMGSMFSGCTGLTSLDLSSFDTSAVEYMWNMFYDCTGLTKLDLGNFDTSAVVDMSGMFYDCRNLRSLDLSSFNTRKVYSMSNMFSGCASIQDILVGDDWLLAEYYEDMFTGCGVDKVTYNSVESPKESVQPTPEPMPEPIPEATELSVTTDLSEEFGEEYGGNVTCTLDTTGTNLDLVKDKIGVISEFGELIVVRDKVTGAEVLKVTYYLYDDDWDYENTKGYYSDCDDMLIEDEKLGNLTFSSFGESDGGIYFLASIKGTDLAVYASRRGRDTSKAEEDRREAYEAFKRLTFTVSK